MLKNELDSKHQHADQMHQMNLEHKINIAQYSAEKKKKSGMFSQGGTEAAVAYDEIPLPIRHDELNE